VIGAPARVSYSASIAASFTGCRRATYRAAMSPEIGCSTAAGAPTNRPMVMPRGETPLVGFLRSRNA